MHTVIPTYEQRLSGALGTRVAYVKRAKNVLSVCITYAQRIGDWSALRILYNKMEGIVTVFMIKYLHFSKTSLDEPLDVHLCSYFHEQHCVTRRYVIQT